MYGTIVSSHYTACDVSLIVHTYVSNLETFMRIQCYKICLRFSLLKSLTIPTARSMPSICRSHCVIPFGTPMCMVPPDKASKIIPKLSQHFLTNKCLSAFVYVASCSAYSLFHCCATLQCQKQKKKNVLFYFL